MLQKLKTNYKNIFLATALTLLLANSTIFSTPSPMAIGLCVFAPTSALLPILLTYLAYFLLFAFDGYNACMFLTAVSVCAIRIRFKKLSTNALISIATGILSGSLVISGIFLNLSVANWLTTAVLLFGFTYLVSVKPNECQSIDISLSVMYIILISSLSCLPMPIFDIGRIVGTTAMLHCARLSDTGKSAIFSTLTGGALLMASHDNIYSAIFISVAGMLLTLVGRKNIIRQPLYLICTALLYGFINLQASNDLFFVVDIFIGSVIYLLTFDIFENKAFRLLTNMLHRRIYSNKTVPTAASVVQALSSLKESVKESSCFVKIPTPPLNSTVAYSKVCLTCINQSSCVADKANDLTVLDSNQPLKYCIHDREVSAAINDAHNKYNYLSERSTDCKRTAKSIINLLDLANDLINESCRLKAVNSALSDELSQRLSSELSGQVTAQVYSDMSCMVSFDNSCFLSSDRILNMLLQLTDRAYSAQKAVKQNGFTYIFAYPIPNYRVTVEIASDTARESTVSGDVFKQLIVENTAYFILSDGMGTGRQARDYASRLTESLAELLKAGLSVTTAIKLSSAITRNTSIDESFATLDILAVNLENGICEFYKSGAADSYILGDTVENINGGGYPIGIFERVFISCESRRLKPEDEIIMATDGAELSIRKISSALSKTESETDLADMLIEPIRKKCSENDDSFVAVIKILQN